MGIGYRCIVDQDMKASRGQGNRLPGQLFDLGLVRQVGLDKMGQQTLFGQKGQRLLPCLPVTVGKDDLCPSLGEAQSQATANPGGATGDQDGIAGKIRPVGRGLPRHAVTHRARSWASRSLALCSMAV